MVGCMEGCNQHPIGAAEKSLKMQISTSYGTLLQMPNYPLKLFPIFFFKKINKKSKRFRLIPLQYIVRILKTQKAKKSYSTKS